MTAAFQYRLRGSGREARSIEDYRRLAHRAVPRMVWAYIDGGAEDMRTVSANRSAFDRWRLRAPLPTRRAARPRP